MAHLILFKEITGEVSWVDCNDLEDYYKHLNCRCFDITHGLEDLDIYVDDEGLLVERPLSAVDSNFKPALVGSLIFARSNEEGETISCTEEDMKLVESRVLDAFDLDHDAQFKVIRLGD